MSSASFSACAKRWTGSAVTLFQKSPCRSCWGPAWQKCLLPMKSSWKRSRRRYVSSPRSNWCGTGGSLGTRWCIRSCPLEQKMSACESWKGWVHSSPASPKMRQKGIRHQIACSEWFRHVGCFSVLVFLNVSPEAVLWQPSQWVKSPVPDCPICRKQAPSPWRRTELCSYSTICGTWASSWRQRARKQKPAGSSMTPGAVQFWGSDTSSSLWGFKSTALLAVRRMPARVVPSGLTGEGSCRL